MRGTQSRHPGRQSPARNFTGDIYLKLIGEGQERSRMIASLVRSTPGARTRNQRIPFLVAALPRLRFPR
jgi:hypothetical protein